MKKLIIAAAIVCAAAFAQASTIKWSSTGIGSTSLYGPDTSTLINTWKGSEGCSITAVYLINAATLSQADLLSGLREGSYTFGESSLDSTSINTQSKIAAKTTGELTSLAGQTGVNVYYAVMATDAKGTESVLISSLKSVDVPVAAGDEVAAAWGAAGGTFSKVNKGEGAFSEAAWYTVTATEVPEPTSGLLLLLGVAGLALRRRRA